MSSTATAIDPYLPDRGDPGVRVTAYDLELDYRVDTNLLDGRARLTASALEPLDRFSLDLAGLRVSAATVDGRRAKWTQRGEKVTVIPAEPVRQGHEVVVELRYRGKPGPTGSLWGPVGWELMDDGVLVAAQPSGACTWFPCNDLAGHKARFTVAITTASAYLAVVNGVLRSTRTRGSTTTRIYEQVEPTSPYLMTVNIGRYVRNDLPGGPVPVTGVMDPADVDAFTTAFARQTEMVEVFVELFGPYPFEAGYEVVVCPEDLEIPLESMGQAVFGRNHLDGSEERLIAHELSHQWFGNSLTAARWSDVWLHEGFACYAEWLWSERSGDRTADDLARHHHGRLRGTTVDRVLIDPGPAEMFDDWIYKRGALTLHALRMEVGDRTFFDLLRGWCADHRHGVVTTEDFEQHAAEAAGRSLGALFDAWLRSVPVPPLPGGRG